MRLINYRGYTELDISQLNYLADVNPELLVQKSEDNYISQLKNVVDAVMNEQTSHKVILLAGPSSSGKTTTALKLAELFNAQGVSAFAVSLDDFYKGKGYYPLTDDGREDYESIYALDIDLIVSCLEGLIKEGRAIFPRFDFMTVARASLDHEIILPEGGVIIIEGIHALNPLISQSLPQECITKVYVSVRTKFLNDGNIIFIPKNIRLMRRMVRDKKFRNHSPISTLERWNSVLEGEKMYIDPYRDDVDVKIDSTLDYEVCIFNNYLLPLLTGLNSDSIYYEQIKELYDSLSYFRNIDEELVPNDSLIREFIG